jgi:phage terminase large subunit-like protein
MTYRRPKGTTANPRWAHAEKPEHLVPLTDDPTGLGERQVRLCGMTLMSQGPASGQRFSEAMLPWQRDIIRYVWGERDEDSNRKVRQLVLICGKGSGKSMFAAALALGHVADLAARGVCSRMVVVVVAASIASANIIFEHIFSAVKSDDELKDAFASHSGRRELKHKKSGIIIRCTPPEAQAVVGVRACMLLVDEVHEAAKSREFNSVVDQARRGGSNAGPDFIEVNISTSPIDKATGYYSKMIGKAKAVRDGTVADESLLPVVYTFPLAERPELQLADSGQWWRAIPSLGSTQAVVEIQREFEQAAMSGDPADMSLFLSQRMCVEPDERHGVGRWVVAERWPTLPRVSMQPEHSLRSATCGIDVGGSDDLAAVVIVGWDERDRLIVHSRQFAVQSAVDRAHPNTRVIYQSAIDSGELIVAQTMGELESRLFAFVKSVEARFGSDLWAGGDQYGLAGFGARFKGTCGLEFRPVKQSFNLLASKNRIEALVSDGVVAHEHLPLLKWNIDNLRLDESTSGIKLRKADSGASGQGQSKIDGVMALLNAVELIEHPDRTAFDVGTMIF